MATSLLLEGEDLEALLARAHAEGGVNTRIVRAERVRRGGFLGFFARQVFEVAVEIPDREPEAAGPEPAGAAGGTPAGTTSAEVTDGGTPGPGGTPPNGTPRGTGLGTPAAPPNGTPRGTGLGTPAAPPNGTPRGTAAAGGTRRAATSVAAALLDRYEAAGAYGTPAAFGTADTPDQEDAESEPEPPLPASSPFDTLLGQFQQALDPAPDSTFRPLVPAPRAARKPQVTSTEATAPEVTTIVGPQTTSPSDLPTAPDLGSSPGEPRDPADAEPPATPDGTGTPATPDGTGTPATPDGTGSATAPEPAVAPRPAVPRARSRRRNGSPASPDRPASPDGDGPAARLAADRRLLRSLEPVTGAQPSGPGGRFEAVLRMLTRIPELDADPDTPVVAVVGPADMVLLEAHRAAVDLAVGLGPRPVVHVPALGRPERQAAVRRCHDLEYLVAAVETNGYSDAQRVRTTLREIRAQVVVAVLDALRDPQADATWLAGIGRVDAVAVHGVDQVTDPARFLRLGVPVIRMDGIPLDRVTWAAMLCARLVGADHESSGEPVVSG